VAFIKFLPTANDILLRRETTAGGNRRGFQMVEKRGEVAAVVAMAAFRETFHLNFKHNLTSVFPALHIQGQAVSHLSTSLQRGT